MLPPDVDGPTLAKLLGLTPRRVQQLAADGFFAKTKRGQYPLHASVQAYISFVRESGEAKVDAENYKAQRAKFMRAKAKIAEIEAARADGSVVEIEEVARQVAGEYAEVRAKLLSLPSRLAQRLAAEKSATIVSEMMMSEIDDVLTSLTADAKADSSGSGSATPAAANAPRRKGERDA